MNWGKWKIPIIGWAGLAFAVWALLYGLYWHDRTGHSVFWGDALVDWIGDVVMLQWTKSYQEMLAGIFALLAATIVLVVAILQRRFAKQDIEDTRREMLERNLALIKRDLTAAQWLFTSGRPASEIQVPLSEALARWETAPPTALASFVDLSFLFFSARAVLTADPPDGRLPFMLFIIGCYFDEFERLVAPNGVITHTRKLLDDDQQDTWHQHMQSAAIQYDDSLVAYAKNLLIVGDE